MSQLEIVLVTQSCPPVCEPMDCSPQAPLSLEFSRQGYWKGLPFPPPGNLPDLRIEPRSPALQADSLLSEPGGRTRYGVTTAVGASGMEYRLLLKQGNGRRGSRIDMSQR